MEVDELVHLQNKFRLLQQGRISGTEFEQAYQRCFSATRHEFDRWRGQQERPAAPMSYQMGGPEQAFGMMNPLAPMSLMPMYSPSASYGGVGGGGGVGGVGGPYNMGLSSHSPIVSPSPSISPTPSPAPVSSLLNPLQQPTNYCTRCNAGLVFEPPPDPNPRRVRCPLCRTISMYQKCWTCPEIIVYDQVCKNCFSRDTNANGFVQTPQALLPSVSPPPTQSSLANPPGFSPRAIPDQKGLTNWAGENNCFLNVTIQSLWHLQSFRNLFESQPSSHAPQCSCVQCALLLIFTNYRFSATDSVAPNVLRKSLDLLYAGENRFQLGELSDAVECFDAICTSLHRIAVRDQNQKGKEEASLADVSCSPLCSAHSAFRLLVEDSCLCRKCGHNAIDVQSMFLHYAYAKEIVKKVNKPSLRSSGKTIEAILRKLNRIEPRGCTECNAAGPFPVVRVLLKPWPKVFGLCIAWADPNPDVSDIRSLLSAVDSEIDLGKVFDAPDHFGGGKPVSKRYRLRGVISYYLQHYAAYFFNDAKRIWLSFDDVSVQEVGPSWKDVIRKCLMGHAKPVLVFYEEIAASAAEDQVDSPVRSRAKHRSILDQRRK